MSRQDFWSCLLVQQFFSDCNWQGQIKAEGQRKNELSESKLSPAPLLKSSPAPLSWQSLSVQQFFSDCNWQGQPLENRNWHYADPSSRLTVQVREFFQFIPWEGNPKIGSLPKLPSIPEPTLSGSFESTLTDLSELF